MEEGQDQNAAAAQEADDWDEEFNAAFADITEQELEQALGQQAGAPEGADAALAEAQPPDASQEAQEDAGAAEPLEGREDDDGEAEDLGGGEGPEEQQAEEDADEILELDQQEALRNERLLACLSETQLERYEAYRRSKLKGASMRKLLQQMLGVQQVPDRAYIAMCGIGKMFVGDLIELARHQAGVEGHEGPLLPRHIQRAYQTLAVTDRLPAPAGQRRKRLFR